MVARAIAALALTAACWGGPSASAKPPSAQAPDELSCKAVVVHASAAGPIDDRDIMLAIGECELKNWPAALRACVGAAHDDDDLAACGERFPIHGSVLATRMSFKSALRVMQMYADEMCACKDGACTQAVSEEMTKWGERLARAHEAQPKLDEESMKRAMEISETMATCMQKAMSATP